MFKKIPPSDISIRPFKVYKTWNFDYTSTEVDILEAENLSNISEDLTSGSNLQFKKKSLWGQLHAQFYNGDEFNPFNRFGSIGPDYNVNEDSKDRYLGNVAKVISIPQKYIGEAIKKNSFSFSEGGLSYVDDGYGNILRTGGALIYVTSVNILESGGGEMEFEDILGNTFEATFDSSFLDLNDGSFTITYNGTEYTLEVFAYDLESGEMVLASVPFLDETALQQRYGNVFYEHGLVVFTRDTDFFFTDSWQMGYKSTQTIYEHEYLLTTNENEFNISTNPTAIEVVGKIEEEIEVYDESNPTFIPYKVKTQPYMGAKYIKKLSYDANGDPIDYRYASHLTSSITGQPLSYAGFEHYDVSGSVDLTGSFLAPYITTIGLYDDDCNLLAVAKLPQPIKSLPDVNLNFIVRFDT